MGGVEETRRVLERWASGEKAAGDLLYQRYESVLRSRARTLLRRSPRLSLTEEDLVQAAWLRAMQALCRRPFQSRVAGGFGRWLHRILERTALNEARKRRTLKREASVLGGIGVDPACVQLPPSDDPTPTSQARLSELTAFCKAALEEREWEVWRRVEIEQMQAVEVALELGMTDSAVRSLVHRSRKKLLEALGRSDEHR